MTRNEREAAAAIRALLVELGWPVVVMEGADAYGTSWGDGEVTYRSLLVADGGTCVFYAQAPEPVPEGRRDAAARMIARANWGLPTAAIEMGLDTGEARVRCGVDLSGAAPSVPLLRAAVLAGVAVATVYLPALGEVAAGADPDAVIAGIEA